MRRRFKVSLLAGTGIITRNHAGLYVMGKGCLKRAQNVNQAESWAMFEAMQLATSYGWSRVIFETDNLNISFYLQKHSHMPPWQSVPLLRQCVNKCNTNTSWSCVFDYRSYNKTDDALAKAARRFHLCG
ncbi:uncharacterized protein LOC113272783 [Papaver somniferum]|uniref:uncharacterized protein LOC113272783 n=1 Tax=Papaver somniferum TaxID=3469 RepID=UPI000E6F86F9|nr:uncharacterized protein LOC113272783 [Papaver somniferum]